MAFAVQDSWTAVEARIRVCGDGSGTSGLHDTTPVTYPAIPAARRESGAMFTHCQCPFLASDPGARRFTHTA